VRKSDPDGLTIEYTYDAAGNLVSRVSPSQSLVYTYDARNRLETVTRTIDGAPPQLTRYAHDAAGNRREMQGADGTRTEYAHDARHRLAGLIKRSAAGALLVGMAYTVDASGMRTAITESDAAGTTRTVAYAYDALKRLTAEAIAHRDPTRNRTSTWTYDRVGNRLTQTVETAQGTAGAATAATQYTYDANDRLTSETTTVGAATAATLYTYDANGNTVTKTTSSGPIEYVYNDANRLAEMRQASERTTYAYDADGLRIGQTRYPVTGDPVTTRYLQDPSYAYSQVIEQWRKEGAGATQLEATYAFADDLIAQTRYAGATATTAFVQADGFGSVRWLTDAAGVVTDGVEYDAFGNDISRQGTTVVEHLYRGEQFDAGLGFYYLRARWMDPGAGRFTQQDTFAGYGMDPPSLHKYSYANSSPILYSDPSGNFGIISIGGLNINVGSAVSFATSRAGLSAAAKFSSELAFEWATGIPVFTSPRGMLQAVKSLRGAVGDLASGAIKRLQAGVDFERTVAELLRMTKNTGCYKDGRPSRPPGCFIPDFFAKGARLVEVKTSMGAVRKRQFQEFMRISLRSGQPMSMVFLRKPLPAEIERLQRWAVEVAGESDDILLNITHVLD